MATILAAGLPMAVVFQKMVGGMQVFSFLAIPFFVFAGDPDAARRHRRAIVRFANSLVRPRARRPGHEQRARPARCSAASRLFVADVSAMGSVMIPLMKKEGYDADYAVNVTTHAALVGALMPTSHNHDHLHAGDLGHRAYSVSVSIGDLMFAGSSRRSSSRWSQTWARRWVLPGAPTRLDAAPSPAGAWCWPSSAALPGLLVVVIIPAASIGRVHRPPSRRPSRWPGRC